MTQREFSKIIGYDKSGQAISNFEGNRRNITDKAAHLIKAMAEKYQRSLANKTQEDSEPDMPELTIDPELAAFMPPLDDEELAALEHSILAEGCRDPLVVWNGTLLDGHHRYSLCQKHGIPFKTVPGPLTIVTRMDALNWILLIQRSRRNMGQAETRVWREKFLKLHPDWTDNRIAKALGADDKTITADRNRREATSEIPKLNRREGSKKKTYKKENRREIAGSNQRAPILDRIPESSNTTDCSPRPDEVSNAIECANSQSLPNESGNGSQSMPNFRKYWGDSNNDAYRRIPYTRIAT